MNKDLKAIRSAKDAINALYSADSSRGLSDYLASSAAELKAASRSHDTKSASSLHSRNKKVDLREAARPSASALLKPAGSAQVPAPVIRTSLQLERKKPGIITKRPSTDQLPTIQNTKGDILLPGKGKTRLSAEFTAGTRAKSAVSALKSAAASTVKDIKGEEIAVKTAKKPTPKPTPKPAPKPVPRPPQSQNAHVFQDVIRKKPAQNTPVERVEASGPASQAQASSHGSVAGSASQRPLDSVKNRFRPAPRDYMATSPRLSHVRQVEDFLSPKLDSADTTPDAAVHIYGMTNTPEPPTEYSDIPDWAATDTAKATPEENPAAVAAASAEKPKQPDNNKYALSGQSPFFLKSVQVDKRPLSGGPASTQHIDTSVYAGQELTEKPKKNHYERKKKSEKPVKTIVESPTVIIPARRRSHAPLFILMLVTVLLGAVVGALAYLFFFQ